MAVANYALFDLPGGQPIADTSTVQAHKLGTIVRATSATYGEGEFVYLLGLASTAVGDAVIFNQYTGVTTRLVAGSKGVVGIAMSANVASQYGWYQISGAAVVNVAAGFAAAADVYATATAGTLDDAVVAGDLIAGLVGVTAIGTPTAGTAVMQAQNPTIT
jgi:hypothetical protein